jgi:Tfp pilus assembly protein FimV
MVTIPYWFIRYAMPAGMLMLATFAILIVRPSYEPALPELGRAQPSPPVHRAPREVRTRSTRASAYSVRSGDTLGSIAGRFGTTVGHLLVLNPGIDPRALRVGQPLRVQ